MPVVAVIWGILDGETLTPMQFVGAFIILAGLIFLRAKTAKIEKPQDPEVVRFK